MQPRYNHVAGAKTSDDVPYQVWPRLTPIAPGLYGDTKGDTLWIVGRELLDPPSHVKPRLEFQYCDIVHLSVTDIHDRMKAGWTREPENRVELAPGIIGDRVSDTRGCVWILEQFLDVSEKYGLLDHLEIRREVEPGVTSVLEWHVETTSPLQRYCGRVDWSGIDTRLGAKIVRST